MSTRSIVARARPAAFAPRAALVCFAVRACLLGAMAVAGVTSSHAQDAQEPPAPVYRVFLNDGSSIAALGEWVRVGERVVFTIAVGQPGDAAALHLASVPVDRVDWPATERYRDALRAAHYAATRGDEDFAVMSNEVARLLSEASLAEDPARKLALAEAARRLLVAWPATHYGHRADEVRQVLALVDEVVAGLRAVRGDTSFDLSLVAHAAPPTERLLPAPTLRESIAQALRLADLAETADDRVSLLRTIRGVLTEPGAGSSTPWVASSRAVAEEALREELATESAYATLRTRVLARARTAAARADVRGVERAIATLRKGDARLGARRPDAVQAMLAALEEQLDAARRLRLARDQWADKVAGLRVFHREGERLVGQLHGGHRALDDIRRLAGPSTSRLEALERRVHGVQQRLAALVPPADARAVHALAVSAAQLARQAATLRRQAVAAADMAVARDAAAAAAGALMLIDRTRAELEGLMRPPELR